MASASYLARVIYKKSSETTYSLLCAAKSIGSPIGSVGQIDVTTLEDDTQAFIEAIHTSEPITVSANLEKDAYSTIEGLKGETLDFVFLYGSTGLGDQLKVKRSGTVTVVPNEVGGVDEVLGMTITITPKTNPEVLTGTVTESSGAFTYSAS